MPVTTACFDVAGAVIDRSVKTTNLPWTMDERSLARDLNLRAVRLINDLEAVERSVPTLRAQDLVTLNEGAHMPVHVITTRATLLGAAAYGLESLRRANAEMLQERMPS